MKPILGKKSTVNWPSFRPKKKPFRFYVPVKNKGTEAKNPPMAQTLVDLAPFKYLVVLQSKSKEMVFIRFFNKDPRRLEKFSSQAS